MRLSLSHPQRPFFHCGDGRELSLIVEATTHSRREAKGRYPSNGGEAIPLAEAPGSDTTALDRARAAANHECMDTALVDAYRETEYRVTEGEPFTMMVDVPCDGLQSLYRVMNSICAVFITAYNPLSRVSSDADNVRRQADLAEELRRRALVKIAGVGQHPSGPWPGEPSYLVLGIDLHEAQELGRVFDQNAIIWCDADAVPTLILLQ